VDRAPGGAGPAGLVGFILPKDASEETRRLYTEKVVTKAWTPEFEKAGNYGGHLDNVNPEFIRDHVAPLITEETTRTGGARLDRKTSLTPTP